MSGKHNYKTDSNKKVSRTTLWRKRKRKIEKTIELPVLHNQFESDQLDDIDSEEISENFQTQSQNKEYDQLNQEFLAWVKDMMNVSAGEDCFSELFPPVQEPEEEIEEEYSPFEGCIIPDDHELQFDRETKQDELDNLLYDGCPITLGTALTVLWSFNIKFKLSGETLNHLLHMIQLFIPKPNILPKSLFCFKKFFNKNKADVNCHYYCDFCLLPCKDKTSICENTSCKNFNNNNTSFFIEFPVEQQLKNILQREDNLQKMNDFKQKRSTTIITDIKDAELYRDLRSGNNFLSNPNTISFTWNTDGVPVFKSSKMSMWPIFMTINELPYRERVHKDNMIMPGIWCGSHPNMSTFLMPVIENLNKLSTAGINIEVAGKKQCVKGILLCGSFDMPAKAIVLNFKAFNSFFGCPKCLQPGENFRTEKGGNVHYFPLNENNPSGPPRNHHQTIQHSLEAVESSKPDHGVKGPSVCFLAHKYDVIRGTSIDYMHGVLLGLTKQLMIFWFDRSFSKEPFSLYSQVTKVEERLLGMSPTNMISRVLRKIQSNIIYWKASEFRSWLLFYAIPVLSGILPDSYFQHFLLLSEGINLLLREEITSESLSNASKMLLLYCHEFEKFYDKRYMTINFHSLLHLPKTVYELGPLWAYSLFNFEDKNGYILSLIHGTQNVSFQIASSVSALQKIPELRRKYIGEGTNEEKFIMQCLGVRIKDKNMFQIYKHIQGGGISKPCDLSMDFFVTSDQFHQMLFTYKKFPKICISNIYIISKDASKEIKRNSSVVYYESLEEKAFFEVHLFLEAIPICNCIQELNTCFCSKDKQYFAIGYKLSMLEQIHISQYEHIENFSVTHTIPVEKEPRASVIEIKCIRKQCLVSKINGKICYAHFYPNNLETD